MRRLAALIILALTIAWLGPLAVTFNRGAPDRFYHSDAQGSRLAFSNSAGVVGARERYAPFGESLLNGSGMGNFITYTGHMRDVDTGLTYMQARFYDPVIGRFLSTDPIGYQDQLNLYAYVANDPVNKVDPTGEYIESLIDVGFLIADVAAIVDSGFTAGNVAALAGDLAGLALPGATGGGLAARAAVEGAQAAGKAADKAGDAAKAANKTCCFVAGTLVETAQGLKPIEEIKIGDLVLARNVETGETTLKPVADLIRRHERVIWEVALAGPGGETERFETTDDHPWWIAGQGWKKTAELAAGMAVVTKDGRGMVVASVTETDRADSTYNLTVTDFETYFVGEQRVLVHNCAISGNAQQTTKGGEQTTHGSTSERVAGEMAGSGKYSSVHMNQTANTITGGGANSAVRPDVAGVRVDNGKVDAVEVLSPGQTQAGQNAKNEAAFGDNLHSARCVDPDRC